MGCGPSVGQSFSASAKLLLPHLRGKFSEYVHLADRSRDAARDAARDGRTGVSSAQNPSLAPGLGRVSLGLDLQQFIW